MTEKSKYHYIVVGAGIVGLATAYKLQKNFPDSAIAILEKEGRIGKHQTGRNSGVIHSGIYYKPGSYKALNCKNGREQLVAFAKENHVNHDICGKIIVATKEEELPVLEQIYQNGIQNQTEGISYLNREEILEKEPYIKGIRAVWVPIAGIIDYVDVSEKFVELISQINPESGLFTSCEVQEITGNSKLKELHTSRGSFKAKKVIFCAGLESDRLAARDGLELDMQIVGFRGDYYELNEKANSRIRNLVYPVPDPKFPFLGVHFTRMIRGGVECGPNAVFTFKREGYSRTDFSLKDTAQALGFKGTWKLFFKFWRKGLDEYKRAFSKTLFVKELAKMMPEISKEDVVFSRSGVRAQAVDLNGNMVDDFKIISHNGTLHVINAPSPAATACLAIADEIVARTIE
jgi:L-2-hydroxyglutarate oxidase